MRIGRSLCIKYSILGKLKILSKHHTSYDVLSDHLTDKGSLITSDLLSDNEHLSRQQLYKNVGITADMLMPIFKRMEYYIQEEVRLLLDETYFSCREKLRLCISPPEDEKGKSKAKGQRSLSKSMRSYFYGIVGDLICLYYHDLDRNSDIPKDILISNNVRDNAFVETDGFYTEVRQLGFQKNC